MRKIISIFFLSFSFYVNSSVQIYSNDTSILGLERTKSGEVLTSTLYGGSNGSGAASPADCIIKYTLSVEDKTYKGLLIPFTTEAMSYSSEKKSTATFEFYDDKITYLSDMVPDVCPMGTDFIGDYKLVREKDIAYKSDFDSLIGFNYTNALKVFRKESAAKAATLLEPYIQESISKKFYYQNIFNDYGFLLQQAGKNDDAIDILKVVINKSPKRVVAYLNIADAYWEVGDNKKSMENYKEYISLMESYNSRDIPKRAIERSQ